MNQTIKINYSNAVLDFSSEYCTNSAMLIESDSFKRVVDLHLRYLKRKDKTLYIELSKLESDDSVLLEDLLDFCKLLLVFSKDDIDSTHLHFKKYSDSSLLVLEFVETLYNYWRSIERYAIIKGEKSQTGLQNQQFIDSHSDFENLVLQTYRTITESLVGHRNRVYRQLIAGVNAGIVVNNIAMDYEKGVYESLKDVGLVDTIVLHPPFISYPRRNKRDQPFVEVDKNPLIGLKIDADDFICFPAKVGKYFAMIYFSKEFMSLGVTLANLFELVDISEVEHQKPDIVYVFGVEDNSCRAEFFHDRDEDIYVGYASSHEDFDYFGYMKKMILTLHNVKGINCNGLPIHGAMANIIMENGIEKNIIIVGDSGAGKSETLESLRALENNGIKDINVIFDDMGILFDEGNKVVAYGTEIGAFVRLDDLDPGYAYKEIDRSIFMNPDKINARITIPIATYEMISKGHLIDMVLYANNYDDSDKIIEYINDVEEAKDVFKKGRRMAKGTTTETGLVESYFANPFGPMQRQEQTDILIDKYFEMLVNENIKVGEIRTKLGLEGYEHKGPKEAAIYLLEELCEK